MENSISVLNSDSVNRAGFRFSIGALVKSMFDHGTEGTPSLINHDFLRPVGWVMPYGVLLEPKLTRTIGNFLFPETVEEHQLINNKISKALNQRHEESTQAERQRFEDLLSDNLSEDGRFLHVGCNAYKAVGIVEKIFPDIKPKLDKDGLVYLDDLLTAFQYLGSGIFKSKKQPFAIYAHQYFRRNLSHLNSPNNDFLETFLALQKTNTEIRLRLAIDWNLIGLADTYSDHIELDYWWGPKFDDDIASLPSDVTRYESDERQRSLSGIQGTEFWWKTDRHEKTLEMEEINTLPSLGVSQQQYGCRYIHSIYDAQKQTFIHFDGAIRMYDEESIMARWDQSINKAGKNTIYTKLFRIDGNLALADWKLLCIYYYRGNTTVYEYFNKKKEVEELMEGTKPDRQADSPLIPYSTKPENGIQLFISHHLDAGKEMPETRTVVHPDTISTDNGTIDVVESEVLELKKILKRNGEDLYLPDDIALIQVFDGYINFPIIFHSGKNVAGSLKGTIDAYTILFTEILKRGTCVVSFSLMVPFEGCIVNISVFGELSSVLRWLRFSADIPLDRKAFEEWLDVQAAWLYQNFDRPDNPRLVNLVTTDGCQFIKRKQIDPKWVEAKMDDHGLQFELSIPEDEPWHKDLTDGKLRPAAALLLKKVLCSKTGQDYRYSDTSKYLDTDTHAEVHACELLAAYWTDRTDRSQVPKEN